MFPLEPNQDKLSEFDFLYVVKLSLVHFRYFYNFKRPNASQCAKSYQFPSRMFWGLLV